MGQRVNPEELREIMRVAHKLRVSAQEAREPEYISLFLRAAMALEERAALMAHHPSDLEIPEHELEKDPALYRHVDLRC